MNKPYPFEELKKLLAENSAVEIYVPTDPNFDQMAAALALRLVLGKFGKSVSVISSSPMTVEFSHLVGVDLVGQKSDGGKDLMITLNYSLDQIEKVSYNDDGGKLNLVVQPKINAPRVEKDQLDFSYQGGNKGLPILLGVDDPYRLGSLSNQVDFTQAVNITTSPNSLLGKLNIVDPEASSYSEIIVGIISGLGLAFNEDAANNLFLGLDKATNSFLSENSGPDTFEAAAVCLRWGAKKPLKEPVKTPFFEKSPAIDRAQPVAKPRVEEYQSPKFPRKPDKPEEQANRNSPSPDWFEPKIFKSSKT